MNSFRSLVYLPVGADATGVFCRDSGLVQVALPSIEMRAAGPGGQMRHSSGHARENAMIASMELTTCYGCRPSCAQCEMAIAFRAPSKALGQSALYLNAPPRNALNPECY